MNVLRAGATDRPPLHVTAPTERRRTVVACAVFMLLAVVMTYAPPDLFRGNWRIYGIDYETLHRYRIEFAGESWNATGRLPGWYPREQMGAPFWSNIQSFPFVPTRLALLPVGAKNLYTCAVLLSASLAALFTFQLACAVGMRAPGAAVAGWTFAATGFFASRVLAGHLGVLEGYPALPLLLWLVERCAGATRADSGNGLGWRQVLPLGLACTCTILCGHPQLPMYALLAGGVYALWRVRGWRALLPVTGAMVAGVGAAGFVLVPLFQLIARSTRVLGNVEKAANDIALPTQRLLAFLFPWRDGWPAPIHGVAHHDFVGYPNPSYFWDTVNYIGWAPWLAAIVAVGYVASRRVPRGTLREPSFFLAGLGIVGLLLALPWLHNLMKDVPGTLVRAPCRLTYFALLTLSLGLGAAVHLVVNARKRRPIAIAIAVIAIVAHATDLVRHDRDFLLAYEEPFSIDGHGDHWLVDAVGDGRVSIEPRLRLSRNRKLDDVGFFDSILLARTYETYLAMTGTRERHYIEEFTGDEVPARALAACGVRVIVGRSKRPLAKLLAEPGMGYKVYEVLDSAPRVSLVPLGATSFLSRASILENMKPGGLDVVRLLLLPSEERDRQPRSDGNTQLTATSNSIDIVPLTFTRPTPDEFVVAFESTWPGYVRILETFDEGWSAKLDGLDVSIVPANASFMAVAASPGTHELKLTFRTPGRVPGAVVSACSLVALCGFCLLPSWMRRRTRA